MRPIRWYHSVVCHEVKTIRPDARCAFGLLLLAISGCGGKAGASPKPTPTTRPTPHVVVATPTPVPAAPTPTETPRPVDTATSTATPRPASPTAAPTQTPFRPIPPRVVAASVVPQSVVPGGRLSLSVTTLGSARRVQLYLSAGPAASAGPFSYELTQSSDGHWTSSIAAPTVPNTYYFTVGLFDEAGHRATIQNDAWMVTVRSQAPPRTAQPFPADIPLAPGFSYGNPQVASFTAEGRTIQGSVVSSTTNIAADGSALGQFYAARLPRAGWAVDAATVPPAGATSWSIVASSDGRFLVVQFGSGTLRFYYGTP